VRAGRESRGTGNGEREWLKELVRKPCDRRMETLLVTPLAVSLKRITSNSQLEPTKPSSIQIGFPV
jgi:hypothetical protein